MKKLKNAPNISFTEMPNNIVLLSDIDLLFSLFRLIITSRTRNIDDIIDIVAPNLGNIAHAIQLGSLSVKILWLIVELLYCKRFRVSSPYIFFEVVYQMINDYKLSFNSLLYN